MKNYIVESDFVHNGLRCAVVFGDRGYRCGYVGVTEDSPLYGLKCDSYLDMKKEDFQNQEIGKRGILTIMSSVFDEDERIKLDLYFNVHGGLTYANGSFDYPVKSPLWWFGFDCGHSGDGTETGLVKRLWGEDPRVAKWLEIEAMYPTYGEIRTKQYCEAECRSLADQIRGLEFRMQSKERIKNEC